MRRTLIGILLLVMFSMDASAQINMQAMVDQKAKALIAAQGIPGAAIAIYYQGHEYLYTYGYADKNKKIPVSKDTIFDLASVTKIFTTTLLATQIQAGKIKLTDPIVKYVPDLAKTTNLPVDQITVLALATHTAGLPRDTTGLNAPRGDKNSLMQGLKQWHPAQTIGTSYLYSNVSFGLLGLVLQGAAGQSYMTLLNKNVLQPLNMTHTFVDVPQDQIPLRAQGFNKKGLPAKLFVSTFLEGGGSLRSSAGDMLQFLKANLNVPTANATPQLLQAMQMAQQAHYTINPNFIMALGWQRITKNGKLYITKNGSNIGFSSFIGFSPDKKFGVVVLANKSATRAGQLGWQILDALS